MKTIFLSVLISMLGVISSYAQDTLLIDPVKIDSLQSLINQSSEGKEKVRLLNEYARLNFYNQEYKTGLMAAVDARELSREINFSGGEIMFQITIATFLGWGDLQDYHLMQARVLSVQNKEADLYSVPPYPKGYPPDRDYELRQKLLPALTYFEKSGNKEIQAIILNPIGASFVRDGDLTEDYKLLNRAIELYTDLDQLYPLFLYHKYRMIVVDWGDFDIDKKQLENELIAVLSRTTGKNQLMPFYHHLAGFYAALGQSGVAMDYYLKSIEFFKSSNNLPMLFEVYDGMARMYANLEMYIKQAEIVEKQIMLIEQLGNPGDYNRLFQRSVWAMYAAKRYDKAREYVQILLQTAKPNEKENLSALKNSLEGQILMDYNRYEEAIPFLRKSYNFYSKLDNRLGSNTTSWEAMHLANCYYQTGELDEALRLGIIALQKVPPNQQGSIRLNRKISLVLYEVYNALDDESQAFKYLKQYHEWVEKTRIKDNANLMMEAEVRSILEKSEIEITKLEQEQILKEQQSKIQRIWIFSIAGALISAIIIALVLFRNNKNKQKANAKLKEQKEEIQSTLEILESTQSQLIQSEKMASLGELTAGIAHEIQNPLNFVNNFSEVNDELIEELREAVANNDQKEIQAILDDLKENESKIKHHGQRAEGIVKGMLQHSRTSQGEKEPTDINALADEYLRLAYHGMRAKDKSFNAEFKTDFDPNLPKVNVVPQDIGRVLLNLINNAFYAVKHKSQRHSEQSRSLQAGRQESGADVTNESYKPEVTVSTKILPPTPSKGGEKYIEITVSDNGPGIPEEIKEKIFQPFFTTKPTGKGTGLGLSLSYDIITKGHGGEILLNAEITKGTEFIIRL